MFEVRVRKSFAAAHNLRNYNGKCEKLHGHNWVVEVTARAAVLDDIEIAIDFTVLKRIVNDELELLDHRYLNEIPPFDQVNPTSERIAEHLFRRVGEKVNDARVRVVRVDVWETESNRASYFE